MRVCLSLANIVRAIILKSNLDLLLKAIPTHGTLRRTTAGFSRVMQAKSNACEHAFESWHHRRYEPALRVTKNIDLARAFTTYLRGEAQRKAGLVGPFHPTCITAVIFVQVCMTAPYLFIPQGHDDFEGAGRVVARGDGQCHGLNKRRLTAIAAFSANVLLLVLTFGSPVKFAWRPRCERLHCLVKG